MEIAKKWIEYLEQQSSLIINQVPLNPALITRKDVPTGSGVYIFTDRHDSECLYIGQSIKLRERIFNSHLYGMRKSSFREALLGLKKNQIYKPICTYFDLSEHMKNNMLIRYLEIKDTIERGCMENYLIAILIPKYSVPAAKR